MDSPERDIDAWMKQLAATDHTPRLPDPNSLWVKAKLLQSTAAMERASRPLTRFQIAAYLIVAGGWAALVTWKWSALQAWINSFTPAHIIMGAVIDENMLQDVRVTVLATGFGGESERFAPQARAIEPAPVQQPRQTRFGVNPATPAKAVDLDLPPFLQQKNRQQP